MNAKTAKELASRFNRRTISERILDDIQRCASKGEYSYVFYGCDKLTAAAVKYAFIELGYNVVSHQGQNLFISWYQ